MEKFGIPTIYKNTKFRSRLEARWAAFFDLVEWNWEYEPIDLKGYIPDFIIKWKTPLLVEVKPALELIELAQYTEKIEKSGWKYNTLLVGAFLFSSGWFAEDDLTPGIARYNDDPLCWDNAVFMVCLHNNDCRHSEPCTCAVPCGKLSLFRPEMGWNCFRCGMYGKHYGSLDEANSLVIPAWEEAGNIVRWKMP